jgi:hypothetical protein
MARRTPTSSSNSPPPRMYMREHAPRERHLLVYFSTQSGKDCVKDRAGMRESFPGAFWSGELGWTMAGSTLSRP